MTFHEETVVVGVGGRIPAIFEPAADLTCRAEILSGAEVAEIEWTDEKIAEAILELILPSLEARRPRR